MIPPEEEEGHPIEHGEQEKTGAHLGRNPSAPAVESGEEDGVGFPLALLGKDARDQKAGEEAQNDNDRGGKLIKLLPACGVVHVHGGLQRLVLLDQIVLFSLGEGEGVVRQPLLEQTDPVGVEVRGILRGEGVGGEVVEGLEILGIGAVQQVPD